MWTTLKSRTVCRSQYEYYNCGKYLVGVLQMYAIKLSDAILLDLFTKRLATSFLLNQIWKVMRKAFYRRNALEYSKDFIILNIILLLHVIT